MSFLKRAWNAVFGGGETPRRSNRRPYSWLTQANAGTGFQGGKLDRLTEEWNPTEASPFAIHRMDARLLRARIRDLVMNDPLAGAAISAYIANVVECGITPKPALPGDDSGDRRRVWQDEWKYWCNHEADITEDQHYYELMGLWLREVLEAGGCISRYRNVADRGRRVPANLELVPEERFSEERDTVMSAMRRRTPRGRKPNEVSRGVEIDASRGRAVAYWVKPFSAVDALASGSIVEPIRIPRSEADYSYFRRRIGQYRGISVMHGVVKVLWRLGYYFDNELMASAVRSCYTAVVKSNSADDGIIDNDEDGVGAVVDMAGNKLERLQPAMIGRLGLEEDIEMVGPSITDNSAGDWLRLIQRLIAAGVDLSYEELCRDYSQGNFSSTRQSANADRKRFRPAQKFTIYHFCQPTYEHFVRWAVIAGRPGFPTPAEYAADPEAWHSCAWRAPGWQSVNPKEDAQAAHLRLADKTTSRDAIISAEGGDWEETFEQIDEEYKRAESLEFDLEVENAQNELADGERQGGQTEDR